MCRNFKNACLQIFFTINIILFAFFWTVQCIFIWAHYIDFRTLFVSLTQKKITSYLDDDDKASLQEKGHLPVKEINDKISLSFAGARFDFTS